MLNNAGELVVQDSFEFIISFLKLPGKGKGKRNLVCR